MVKGDTQSLELLSKQISKQRDNFLLRTNEIFALESKLESCWDAEKCGSFREAMNTIKGARFDVDDSCSAAVKEISEMIVLINKYNSIKF